MLTVSDARGPAWLVVGYRGDASPVVLTQATTPERAAELRDRLVAGGIEGYDRIEVEPLAAPNPPSRPRDEVYRPWTPKSVDILTRHYREQPITVLARWLRRGQAEIRAKAHRLGLSRRRKVS